MTADTLLLDTGPLVALLHADDRHHRVCRDLLASFRGLLVSTEAVLTEAMHLVARIPGGHQHCLEFFIRGGAMLVPATRESLARCKVLMARYADVPMDFADATLVVLAEEVGLQDIFTLDPRGLETCRLGKRGAFRLLPGSSSV